MMDCRRLRELLEDEIDGVIAPADARSLEEHVATCHACARARELLSEIDAALLEAPVERAPRWLPMAVAREIRRESVLKSRVEPIAVGIASAAGVFSTVVAIVRATGGQLGDAAARAGSQAGSFMQSLMTMPGVPTAWSESPGIAGFVWGLAIASFALVAVSVYRYSRQLSVEWR
jgi:anti-sigma factor RsiW